VLISSQPAFGGEAAVINPANYLVHLQLQESHGAYMSHDGELTDKDISKEPCSYMHVWSSISSVG
jgi:hypothetical protein